jgi:hypothetical protein
MHQLDQLLHMPHAFGFPVQEGGAGSTAPEVAAKAESCFFILCDPH